MSFPDQCCPRCVPSTSVCMSLRHCVLLCNMIINLFTIINLPQGSHYCFGTSPLVLPSTDLLNRALTLYDNNFRVSVTVASFFSGSNGLLLFYFKQLWKWLHKAMPSLCLVVHVFLISALVAEFSLDLQPLYSSSEVTRFKTSSISTTLLWLW